MPSPRIVPTGILGGRPGTDGRDGANVLPTAEAVRDSIQNDAIVQTALSASIEAGVDPIREISDPAFAENLAASIGAVTRRGPRLFLMTDSTGTVDTLEPGINGADRLVLGGGWFELGTVLADQSGRRERNLSIFGQRTRDMIARFDTDTANDDLNGAYVVCGYLANDVADGMTFAEYKADTLQLSAKIEARGGKVWIEIPPPRADTPERRQKAATWAKWRREYAIANGYDYTDFFALCVDPFTGNYLPEFGSEDQIHPGYSGQVLMAQKFADQLRAKFGPSISPRALDQIDADNFVSDPFQQLAPSGGRVGDWGWIEAPAGLSAQVVQIDGVIGNLQQITSGAGHPAGAPGIINQGSGLAGFAIPGDVLEVSFVISNTGPGRGNVDLKFGAGINPRLFRSDQAIPVGRVYARVTVPSGANQIAWDLSKESASGGGPGGTVAIGERCVYNPRTNGSLSMPA